MEMDDANTEKRRTTAVLAHSLVLDLDTQIRLHQENEERWPEIVPHSCEYCEKVLLDICSSDVWLVMATTDTGCTLEEAIIAAINGCIFFKAVLSTRHLERFINSVVNVQNNKMADLLMKHQLDLLLRCIPSDEYRTSVFSRSDGIENIPARWPKFTSTDSHLHGISHSLIQFRMLCR